MGSELTLAAVRINVRCADIAAVRQSHGDPYLIEALSEFQKEAAAALDVAKGFNPELIQGILSGLTVRGGFTDLVGTAQVSTIEL